MYTGNKSGKITGSNSQDKYLRGAGRISGYFYNNYLEIGEELKNAGIKYICPNLCEGYKYYSAACTCPICQMNLFPLGAEDIFY